ncbi:hypothetical protein ABZX68_27620 [Streptomyces cellulosae]
MGGGLEAGWGRPTDRMGGGLEAGCGRAVGRVRGGALGGYAVGCSREYAP